MTYFGTQRTRTLTTCFFENKAPYFCKDVERDDLSKGSIHL